MSPAAAGDVAACDLATRDKIPVIRELLSPLATGYALDIGVGTGYTTRRVFGDRPLACVDIHAPNLRHFRDKVAAAGGRAPLCVVAEAGALPFRDGAFTAILCSEVLEHLDDDEAAVAELARLLAAGGAAVVTVPYTGLRFTSFLELAGVKTVHDFPGPERHVRPGYDEASLEGVLARHGLRIDHRAYYLRFFTRLVADLVSLAHLAYQWAVHGRRAWTWSEAAAAEGTLAFSLYRAVFPALGLVAGLDRWLQHRRGFGIVVRARRRSGPEADGVESPLAGARRR